MSTNAGEVQLPPLLLTLHLPRLTLCEPSPQHATPLTAQQAKAQVLITGRQAGHTKALAATGSGVRLQALRGNAHRADEHPVFERNKWHAKYAVQALACDQSQPVTGR